MRRKITNDYGLNETEKRGKLEERGKVDLLISRWARLLAHNHWITLHIFGRELRLCARCSGVVLGFITLKILLTILIFSMSYSILFHIGFPVSLLLALPSIVDWTTQSLGFRQSNNNLRLATGFLEGAGVALLSLTNVSTLERLLILWGTGLGVLCMGILGRRLATLARSSLGLSSRSIPI